MILSPRNHPHVNISKDAESLLQSWGNDWIEIVDSALSPGPYFYKDNALLQVMRLYADVKGAFLVSIRRQMDDDCTYEILNDGKHGW